MYTYSGSLGDLFNDGLDFDWTGPLIDSKIVRELELIFKLFNVNGIALPRLQCYRFDGCFPIVFEESEFVVDISQVIEHEGCSNNQHFAHSLKFHTICNIVFLIVIVNNMVVKVSVTQIDVYRTIIIYAKILPLI